MDNSEAHAQRSCGGHLCELATGGMAPLGTFSARIKAARAVGLLSRDECQDLEKIRKLRNEFAHEWEELSLQDRNMAAICRGFYFRNLDIPAEKQEPRYEGHGNLEGS